MQNTIVNTASTLFEEGKKSLDTLLREKAYDEVITLLKQEDIDPNTVAEDDIEALVAARVNDKMNGIKGFAAGTAFALLFTALVGF